MKSRASVVGKNTSTWISPVVLIVLLMCTGMPAAGQRGATNGEWRAYGADLGNTKYSPLDQINRDNFKDLRIAWRWKTDNFGPRPDFNYEATPLMVGGVLYVTAGSGRDVVAIDGATGETLWMFRSDEGRRGRVAPNRAVSGRGVGYWTNGQGDERIIHVSAGYRLMALNAKTGQPIKDFGKNGIVDLYEELDQPPPQDGQVSYAAAPTVVRNVVIVGMALGIGRTKEFVKGYVRGYDVRTGKRIWIFHTIPQPGEFGHDTWEDDSWSYTGHTGSWGGFAADEELGYVYVPVETPTNDMYGGHRPGDGLFGESLVCLDATTGRRIWHFQLVHHGLWDYDIPTAPSLVDVTVNGKKVKAVAQVTKQAFTYVFDRVTGQPIWPIEERPVPQSDVPGEKSSPTQPFPTKPPAFDRQGLTLEDLIDFTPEIKAEAVRIASQYKMGPLFTPGIVSGSNGLKGLLLMPAAFGGVNWQGAAVDPETGILYVPSVSNPHIMTLVHDPKRSEMNYVSSLAGFGEYPPKQGCGAIGPQGLPLVKPPYGRITAVDLNTGDQLWMVPNGNTPDCIKHHPALKGVTIPNTGGSDRAALMVTKTLLLAGEGTGLFAGIPWLGGPMFRAYDKNTGEVVGEIKLPANQSGVPMTYAIDGRQYIVVAVSGRNQPGELVALTLP